MGWQMGNVDDTGWYRRKANTEMNGWRPVWRVNIPIKSYKYIIWNFGAMLWSKFFNPVPLFAIFFSAPWYVFGKNNHPTGWYLPRFEARRGPGSPGVFRTMAASTGFVGADWKVFGTMGIQWDFNGILMGFSWDPWFSRLSISWEEWSQVMNSYYQTVLVTICRMLDTD